MSIVNDFINIFDPDFTDTDNLKDTLVLLGAFALGYNSASFQNEVIADKVNDLFFEHIDGKYDINIKPKTYIKPENIYEK